MPITDQKCLREPLPLDREHAAGGCRNAGWLALAGADVGGVWRALNSASPAGRRNQFQSGRDGRQINKSVDAAIHRASKLDFSDLSFSRRRSNQMMLKSEKIAICTYLAV